MVRIPAAVLLLLAAVLGGAPGRAPGRHDPLPTWVIAPAAGAGLADLWARSIATRRERVACLGGMIAADTVVITRVRLLDADHADSLNASADRSLSECGAPTWIGTVHSHVRSTDDPDPVPRFSPGDRMVMSAWSIRWSRQGAFCVLYSKRSAHCEVYPPHRPATPLPQGE